jgi:signal transduction histidine kinase
MRFSSNFIAGLLAFALATVAWGEDLIVSRAALQDKAGTLTIEQVVQSDFQPSSLILSKGYTDSVHWLRLRIKAPASGEQIELRIRPTYLDEVQLYEPDVTSSSGWKKHVTGDRYAFNNRERAAITLGFVIHPTTQETTYYLRLKTASSSLLNVMALTPREARLKDMRLDVFQIFYLGVMLWLLFWALHDYQGSRQTLTIWFLIYQVSYIAYDLAVTGYLAPFVPDNAPQWADQITSFLVVTTVFLSIVFHRNLFRLYAPPKLLMRGLDALMLIYPLLIVAMATGHARIALQINSMILLLMSLFFIGLAMTAQQESAPSRRVLRIIFGIQSFSLFISMLPLLGIVEAVDWNLQATIIHGLVSGILMFTILHLRSRKIAQTCQQAQLELALARQHLELERAQKEDQNRFINMLTHELKTPLSVLRMVIGTPAPSKTLITHANRAVHDMNNVIEHCVQADKLADSAHELHFTEVLLMSELDDLRRNNALPERIDIQSQIAPTLNTDAHLLRIILNNLIDNALKYSPPESAVKIIISKCNQLDANKISVEIENLPSVAGWPDPEKVFQKYYRSPAAHHQIGTGLGLYLIENMARQLGGKIDYAPDDLHIRFTLWLPA